jgi:hypothetical protein
MLSKGQAVLFVAEKQAMRVVSIVRNRAIRINLYIRLMQFRKDE